MLLRSVFGKMLLEQRRGIVAWCIGLAAIGALYAGFYPLIRGPEYEELLKLWPPQLLEALGFADIASAGGYLEASTFGLLGAIVMIVYASWLGSRAIAGDEESDRLDLVLAHPVSRWRVYLERLAAMLMALIAAPLVLLVVLLVIRGPAELGSISPANLAAGTVHLASFGIFFGAVALGIGGVSGRRSAVFAAIAIAGLGGYIANALAALVDGLDWVRRLSPFFYNMGNRPLSHGLQPVDVAVLLGAAALLLLIGGLRFDRRDIAV
jgi:ABC-2 type transport system permease protein